MSKIPYVTYDDVPVDVTVTVIRNDEGRLTAKVAYSKAGASSNVFTNIYNCKEDDNNPKTGETDSLRDKTPIQIRDLGVRLSL